MKIGKDEIRHLAYFDAIRGVAFLAVLAIHSSMPVGSFPMKWVFANGYYGVQLFFLTSAITLCYSATTRQHREKYPWVFFYIRRIFRIAPLFWLAILFYWLVPGPVGDAQRQDLLAMSPTGIHPGHFILTALFMNGWHPYTINSVVPGGWSIAVEMTFYVIFPLLFIYLNTLERCVLAVLGYLALAPLKNLALNFLLNHAYPNIDPARLAFFKEHWFPTSLPVFLIGIGTFHLLRGPLLNSIRKSRALSIYTFVALFLLMLNLRHLGQPLIIITTLAAMICAISSPQLNWLVSPILCYIGKISYSCYLIHFFMLKLALYLLNMDKIQMSTGSGSAHFALIILIALPLTVAASTLTWHLVEQPSIAAGRWFIRRIQLSIREEQPVGKLSHAG